MLERSVIVEHGVKMPDGKVQWAAVEVRYENLPEHLRFGKPEVLSMRDGEARTRLEELFVALVSGRGEFFQQVSKAVVRNEKRISKGDK